MRRLEQVGALRQMAARADLDLSRRRQYRILGRVQCMTTRAGHIARRVRTGRPIMPGIQLVAAQTLRILSRRGGECLGAEIDHARERSTLRPHMCAARAVTGFALQTTVTERAVWILRTGVLGTKDPRNRGVAVTAKAGVGSLRAVSGLMMRRTDGLYVDRRGSRWLGRECTDGMSQQQNGCGHHAGTQ